MSVQAMSWVFDHSESEGNARLVLLSIANHADASGENAWPAKETIAKEARCSRSTVTRAIETLKALKELDWEQGAGFEGSRRKSNLYRLPKLGAQNEPLTESDANDKGSPENKQGLILVAKLDDKGSPVSREPSLVLEPSLNHPYATDPFEEFWKAYPKKRGGKKPARVAWEKRLKSGADPASLIAAAVVFHQHVIASLQCGELESMKFVALPTTWLNQERDQDTLTTPGFVQKKTAFQESRDREEQTGNELKRREQAAAASAGRVGVGHDRVRPRPVALPTDETAGRGSI